MDCIRALSIPKPEILTIASLKKHYCLQFYTCINPASALPQYQFSSNQWRKARVKSPLFLGD
jgi:hypothetical protein